MSSSIATCAGACDEIRRVGAHRGFAAAAVGRQPDSNGSARCSSARRRRRWRPCSWRCVVRLRSAGAAPALGHSRRRLQHRRAGPQACRAPGVGACWADRRREAAPDPVRHLPLRAAMAAGGGDAAAVVMYVVSALPRMWNWRLAAGWPVALGAVRGPHVGRRLRAAFRAGRPLGRPAGHADPGDAGPRRGLPAGDLLALVRHSARGGIGKALAVAYIELVRGVPLLAVLFLASVMIPLFLPQGMDVSKLLRVFVAFALFTAAYLAEVIRGGLQACPKGQSRRPRHWACRPSRHDPDRPAAGADDRAAGASSTSSSPSSRPPRSSSSSASST